MQTNQEKLRGLLATLLNLSAAQIGFEPQYTLTMFGGIDQADGDMPYNDLFLPITGKTQEELQPAAEAIQRAFKQIPDATYHCTARQRAGQSGLYISCTLHADLEEIATALEAAVKSAASGRVKSSTPGFLIYSDMSAIGLPYREASQALKSELAHMSQQVADKIPQATFSWLELCYRSLVRRPAAPISESAKAVAQWLGVATAEHEHEGQHYVMLSRVDGAPITGKLLIKRHSGSLDYADQLINAVTEIVHKACSRGTPMRYVETDNSRGLS